MPLVVHWPDGVKRRRRAAAAVPPRQRRRRHALRHDRRRGPGRTPRPRADPGQRRADDLLVRRRRRPDREEDPVLRDGRPSGPLARRLEGRHPPRPRTSPSTTTRGSSTTSTSTRRSATTSPPRCPRSSQEMIDLWWQEAEEHGVLPLDDRMIELFGARFRDHSPHPADMRYVYKPPMSMLPMQAGAPMGGRSWALTGRVDDVADGVLFATGTENSGISVFVQDGNLVLDYNAFDDHTIVASDTTIPTDARELQRRVPAGVRAQGPGPTLGRRRAGRRRRDPVGDGHASPRSAPASAATSARRSVGPTATTSPTAASSARSRSSCCPARTPSRSKPRCAPRCPASSPVGGDSSMP